MVPGTIECGIDLITLLIFFSDSMFLIIKYVITWDFFTFNERVGYMEFFAQINEFNKMGKKPRGVEKISMSENLKSGI